MSVNQPVIEVDLSSVKAELIGVIKDEVAKIKEAVVPKEQTKSLTEKIGGAGDIPFDYRKGVEKRLLTWEPNADIRIDKGDYDKPIEEIAVATKGEKDKETKYALKESYAGKLSEAIGTIDQSNCCIPSIWADKIERDHVYPGSVFLGAWFVNWYTDIEEKPGNKVYICRVGPAVCGDLTCDEPTATAPEIACPYFTLEHDFCAYAICKNTMEVVQGGLVDALDEGLGLCLQVCVDNYFFDIALSCTNRGTLAHTGRMTGSLILEAMATMQAGTYDPVKLIMHPVPYKHLMQDTNFSYASRFGSRDVISGGRLVEAYGLEINETPKGTLHIGGGTYRSLLLAKGALAGGLKHGITIETEYSPRLQKRWIIADIKYGGVCLHPDGIYWIHTVET